jgi:hypothetical protein
LSASIGVILRAPMLGRVCYTRSARAAAVVGHVAIGAKITSLISQPLWVDDQLFSATIVMALLTTLVMLPLLHLALTAAKEGESAAEPAVVNALRAMHDWRVGVLLSRPALNRYLRGKGERCSISKANHTQPRR